MFAGSLLAGLMMDVSRLRNAFPAGAVMMMVCLGLFMLLTHHKQVVSAKADPRTGPLDLEGLMEGDLRLIL